jgi:hypothetical protein
MAPKGFYQYNRRIPTRRLGSTDRRLGSTDTGTQGNYLNPTAPNYIGPVVPQSPVAPATQWGRTAFSTQAPTRATIKDDPLDGRSPDAYEGNLAVQQGIELAEYLAGGDPPSNAINLGGDGDGGASARAKAGAFAQKSYLDSLLAGSSGRYQTLRDALAGQQTSLNAEQETLAKQARDALTARYTTATTDTTAAYNDLLARLTAQPRAFADVPAATAPTLSESAVSRYAQAIGAPTQAIGEAAVQAATESAGTQDNYNRLLKVLRANEESQRTSRLAGVGMGSTSAAAQLLASKGLGIDRIEAQKQVALGQILAAIKQGQFGIDQSELGYRQSLEAALAGIYGTGYLPNPSSWGQ